MKVISADAGIWLAFLRDDPSARELRDLLNEQRVAMHPFVLLELRLRLRSPERTRILADLEHLASCPIDPPEVISTFVEERGLARFQVGVIGVHLLASAVRHRDQLWASDRELRTAAAALNVAFRAGAT